MEIREFNIQCTEEDLLWVFESLELIQRKLVKSCETLKSSWLSMAQSEIFNKEWFEFKAEIDNEKFLSLVNVIRNMKHLPFLAPLCR